MGTYLILGPLWVGAHLRVHGHFLFPQHFQQARTFLENNITRDNNFISLQQDKTKGRS